MSDEKKDEDYPYIRLPLWQVLDALSRLEGDEYCTLRDEIIKAWKSMEETAFEDSLK